MLSRPAEEWKQDAEIDWLDQIVVKHRGRGAFLKHPWGITRIRDDEGIPQFCVAPERCGDLVPVHSRKPDIEKKDIGFAGPGNGHGVAAVVDGFYLETDKFQQVRQTHRQVAIILRNQNESLPEELHRSLILAYKRFLKRLFLTPIANIVGLSAIVIPQIYRC
jgi:hypothetical protein